MCLSSVYVNRALYIFDLDGVIYRGNNPQPYAAETIATLKARGCSVFYLTNNASQTRQTFADKLLGMGIPATADEFMTSSYGTALWFREFGHTGKRVYVVGENGCKEELTRAGMHIVDSDDCLNADFVVVGMDRSFNYERLNCAQQAILHGATFIATNRDPTYPMETGLRPGGGSIVAAVATAAMQEPITIGKPEVYCIRQILELTGKSRDEAAMVGDRLDTDIAVGNRAGIHTVAVMGGVTTREEAEAAEGEHRPERIIETLRELLEPR